MALQKVARSTEDVALYFNQNGLLMFQLLLCRYYAVDSLSHPCTSYGVLERTPYRRSDVAQPDIF